VNRGRPRPSEGGPPDRVAGWARGSAADWATDLVEARAALRGHGEGGPPDRVAGWVQVPVGDRVAGRPGPSERMGKSYARPCPTSRIWIGEETIRRLYLL